MISKTCIASCTYFQLIFITTIKAIGEKPYKDGFQTVLVTINYQINCALLCFYAGGLVSSNLDRLEKQIDKFSPLTKISASAT